MEIKILESVLERNNKIAAENAKTFKENGVFVLNLMASPGAGKTSFIIKTIQGMQGSFKLGVIEGDIASKVDAEKVQETGVPVIQINTGGACHLDSIMIQKALPHFDLKNLDLLIIENVGNLVCPAEFILGENLKVIILSVPEGDDKPLKYPLMFSESDVIILNKIDLLGLTDFSLERVYQNIKGLRKDIKIFEVSCKTGDGIEDWLTWLKERIEEAM